jgi:2-dehydro-3-deoxy-D-gluconate 5-dehydrogenase
LSRLDLFRLDGKIALVTDCKSGIGKALALALAVNNLVPGYVIGDSITYQVITNHISAQIEDLRGAIVYLASAASNYLNGEILTIDGGWMGR